MASRLHRSFLAAACCVALAQSYATPTLAQDEPDIEARTLAREFALKGAEAFEKHDYANALDRFRRASALYPAPSLSIMEARALAALGQLLSALGKYEETAHTQLAAEAPEAFRQAVSDAEREAQELRPRVPQLEIRVQANPATLAALKLELDGKALPAALVNVERLIDPGNHTLSGTQPNGAPIHVVFSLAEAERRALDVPLETARATAMPAAVEARTTNPNAWLGWSAVGLAAAATTVGVVSGATALSRKSDLDQVCHPGCPASAADQLSSFRTNRTVSYVSFGVGAAALAAGGYLLLRPTSEQPGLAVALGWRRVGLRGTF